MAGSSAVRLDVPSIYLCPDLESQFRPESRDQWDRSISRRSSTSGISSYRSSSNSTHDAQYLDIFAQHSLNPETAFDPLRSVARRLSVRSAVELWEVQAELRPNDSGFRDDSPERSLLAELDCEEMFQKRLFDLKLRNVQFEAERRSTNSCVSQQLLLTANFVFYIVFTFEQYNK